MTTQPSTAVVVGASQGIRAKLSSIGIGPGKTFAKDKLPPVKAVGARRLS